MARELGRARGWQGPLLNPCVGGAQGRRPATPMPLKQPRGGQPAKRRRSQPASRATPSWPAHQAGGQTADEATGQPAGQAASQPTPEEDGEGTTIEPTI